MKKQKKHAGDPTGDEMEDVVLSGSEFAELKKQADERDEYYSRWMKVHADYENTRKRMEKEKSECVRFANEMLIAKLFPIVDNFDMALLAMDTAKDKEAVMEGIKLVQKEFHKVLEDNGVEKIKTDGEQFDPHIHEAVLAVESDEHSDGMVTEEVRAGYKLNDRLLRPAQVKVAKNKGEDNG